MEQISKSSYVRHRDNEVRNCGETPSIIIAPDLIDAWTHERMYGLIAPIVRSYRSHRWLTIGDSGGDAFFLKRSGIDDVIASSLSRSRLDRLGDEGWLDGVEIREINAEMIDMPDESVDVILCKESYHHFPRPPLAFYEFLRVAREAIVLIEPADRQGWRPLDECKVLLKNLVQRKDAAEQLFEAVGNFIYRLSEREVGKMATSLQLPALATVYANSFFHRGSYLKPRGDRAAMFLNRIGVHAQDLLCRLRLMNYGLLAMVIFKRSPTPEVVAALRTAGFKIMMLPRNPYLENTSSAPVG